MAVKVVKPGDESESVLGRFAAERQAIALMDHPNIAAIHDAGTTAEGAPYFVMEWVDGKSIVAHCERQNLGLRARLELFLDVLSAIS